MSEIQIFNNPEFGQLHTITIDGKEYFFGIDVASALLYKRPRKAVIDHCKGVLSQDGGILSQDGDPIIPEGDVYRLIIKAGQQGNSKEIKEKADKFEKWIFDEVLPTIRKTGQYGQKQLPTNPMQLLELHYQALKQVDNKVNVLSDDLSTIRKDLEDFKNDMPILGIEETKITRAVKKKGVECLGGKQSSAYRDKSLRMLLYADLHRQLRREFGVKSYKAIKRNDSDTAISIINSYTPPLVLAESIKAANSHPITEV